MKEEEKKQIDLKSTKPEMIQIKNMTMKSEDHEPVMQQKSPSSYSSFFENDAQKNSLSLLSADIGKDTDVDGEVEI